MSLIRERRKALKLSQEEAAHAAGMSVFKLNRIEAETQPPTVADLVKLAKVYQCLPTNLAPELAAEEESTRV